MIDLNIANGVTSATQPVSLAVDETRTIVLTGSNTWGGQGQGETEWNGGTTASNFVGRFALDGGSQVIGARGSTNGDVRYNVFVVEFDPY